jgi:hypothetical protein
MSSGSEDQPSLPKGWVHRVQGLVPALVDWLVSDIAATARVAFRRAQKLSLEDDSKAEQASVDEEESMETPMDGQTADALEITPTGPTWMDTTGLDAPPPSTTVSPTTVPPVFSPAAASLPRVERHPTVAATSRADELGRLGTAGHGLYLILHADDIHAAPQIMEAMRDFFGPANYYTDTLLQKFSQALRQHGQLIVWGTNEMICQVGRTNVQLWMEGDSAQSSRIGAFMLERADRLVRHGLFCSILTRDELIAEQRAVAALQWLSEVARSCDPLCQTVAERILPDRHLVPLLKADFKMSSRVTKAWYSLLLTLLAVPTFKSHLAAAYCDTYRNVTAKYARGMGVLERSGYTLSVQFLNRVTYVVDLVQSRDLLGKLGKSLLETLLVARRPKDVGGGLDPMHFVLTHRRYSPCISDLKCVLNVKGMPRLFACKGGTFLSDWIKTLSKAQQMDPQTWRHWTQGHVEDESRGWVGAFNASISLGSLFERLLAWEDDETSPITTPDSPLSRDLMPCSELACSILVHGVHKWQRQFAHLYQPTPAIPTIESHRQSPVSLPLSGTAAAYGSLLAMRHMCVAQSSPISFHLPLHRFAATCIRELCLRRDTETRGMADLFRRLSHALPENELTDLFMRLMEFPLLVLTRAAQVRAGLWRRNGPGLNDQVLNYAEPPFCRTMRDADLLMLQFSVLGRNQHLGDESAVGIVFFVHLLVHKLGIFDFCGLTIAPSENQEKYQLEIESGCYFGELLPKGNNTDRSDEHARLPWTFSPVQDVPSSLVLLETFLRLLIVFTSELPHPPPANKAEHTEQARWRLNREVVHRLASGPKKHSDLLEVHHVLSHWDNLLLSEEGKEVNPDDATGAALGTVLSEIADRKTSRGKLEPDKWELRRSAWDMYDPSFFHISGRMHQSAADERPKPKEQSASLLGWEPKPYAPSPYSAHPYFARLRRDTTADATTLAIVYRVMHMHLRANITKDTSSLPGREAYDKDKSETALARAVHLLTLGVFAWQKSVASDSDWKRKGGGSPGSVFCDWHQEEYSPTAYNWVQRVLLASPNKLTGCDWFEGEETLIDLLRRLAQSGRGAGEFHAQDRSVRAGAAWICAFAMEVSEEAVSRLRPVESTSTSASTAPSKKTEADARRKMAKEKAMARMKAQAAKFASMMDVDMDDADDDTPKDASEASTNTARTPDRPVRASSFGSAGSSASSILTFQSEAGNVLNPEAGSHDAIGQEQAVAPPRLLKQRPRCIICNDEESTDMRSIDRSGDNDDGEGQRKRSRRKTENALGFVGYIQASTVMKGGGGTPPSLGSSTSAACGHVGSHVALCGHAVHSECCESYLATVSHREDRAIGKRDDFRCPLCQRLSNCLVPFIDVSVDWIQAPSFLPSTSIKADKVNVSPKSDAEDEDEVMEGTPETASPLSLHEYLVSTPWWVARHDNGVKWDGHSAFVDCEASVATEDPVRSKKRLTRRGVRSLTKRDLYAAWNAMMQTPRFVRRRFRARSHHADDAFPQESTIVVHEPLESTGESVVWRRFMDQVSDISYRADSRRLGDETLHKHFGEFRHYIVEKYAYNMANRFVSGEPLEWPHCVFSETLSDQQRQEMSREKLLSKLFLSVQAFTYSCCCETFEAKRAYIKSALSSSTSTSTRQESSLESLLSRFGMVGVGCNGQIVLMPHPSADEDEGSQPFSGRLGKLRYFGLAVMAAAGAVAADLVQLALPFPLTESDTSDRGTIKGTVKPGRAPIAYPILFGNVLTHVVASMCATCGRGRARSDSLELAWPAPFSNRGNFFSSDAGFPGKDVDSVIQDCEGFMKLGLVARILQVLLAHLQVPSGGFESASSVLASLRTLLDQLPLDDEPDTKWTRSCIRVLECALSNSASLESLSMPETGRTTTTVLTLVTFEEAATAAVKASCDFLAQAGSILQILVPGVLVDSTPDPVSSLQQASSPVEILARLRFFFNLEQVDEMLSSTLTRDILAGWYEQAVRCGESFAPRRASGGTTTGQQVTLATRLTTHLGFRDQDWPCAGVPHTYGWVDGKPLAAGKTVGKLPTAMEAQPEDSPTLTRMQIEAPVHTARRPPPPLVTFSSKKSVPLLGGSLLSLDADTGGPPRLSVTAMPTSYTDLYAELGRLLPDCEQTAVCLVCGQVLNAGGRGECTKHASQCGAGAGLFFLLQECSGLLLHKTKAAYGPSPYVDSHGETPQYRGRPLNLDVARYEHLREVWYGHAVRQQVVAERGSARQVILPDFY